MLKVEVNPRIYVFYLEYFVFIKFINVEKGIEVHYEYEIE